MYELSRWLFFIAFGLYLFATFILGAGLIGTRFTRGRGFTANARVAVRLLELGVLAHGAATIARGLASGHTPVANMYEFLTFSTLMIVLAFVALNRRYDIPGLGVVVAPLAVVMIGYASLFPSEVRPLIPALQSTWLSIHVTLAAGSEGIFAVSFGAALLYLLRSRNEAEPRYIRWATEGVFLFGLTMLAYSLLALAFRGFGSSWFVAGQTYHLPPLLGPAGAKLGVAGSLIGLPLPLLVLPAWMQGKNMNTMLFALGSGLALYGLIRAFIGSSISQRLSTLVEHFDPETLDEVSYRAIAIGYPIFTLGGLVFAMIWAQRAWGRYWSWDPKETWAFITWLVYSLYLHMRIQRGWEGKPAAVVAIAGFGVVLFTLIGVNLLIVGLHSYANPS